MAAGFDLGGFAYAHRGLWSADGPPENSLAAFAAAARAGVGVELDVRLTADGVPIVFHDPILDRMTNGRGLVARRSAAEINALSLAGSAERPPRFDDVLAHWPGAAPLLVELKTDGGSAEPLVDAGAARLADWDGPAAVMSFSAPAIARLKDAAPSLARGLLIEPKGLAGDERFAAKLSAASEINPDYLAVWTADAEEAAVRAASLGCGLAAWTVTDASDAARLSPIADAIIFEGLDPSLVRP